MPIKDYIISTLNLEPDEIKTFDVVRKEDVFYTHLTIKDNHPCFPVCGGPTKSKGYVDFTFQTMPVNSFTHYVIWHRRRYICKDPDCHHAFREENRFTPGSLHSSYSLMNQIAKDLHNLHFTYKDIALKNNVSLTQIEVYADSFLNVPRLPLPENIGIDELCSDMSKYGSAYLCVMVDNTERDLFEICQAVPSMSLQNILR